MAAANFIQKSDYKRLIQDKHLDQLIGENEHLLDSAELYAQATIEGYLSNIYDISQVFFPIKIYKAGETYIEGERVYYMENFYEVIAESSNELPSSDDYIQRDTRHPIIINLMIDLALYELLTKISPNQIPEIREIRKTDAMELLKAISKGEISISLPKKENQFIKPYIVGQPKKEWYY